MFDLGFQELIVIFVVALLVFGPKRLPELARSLGKSMGQLKKALADIKDEVDREAEAVQEQHDIPSWKKTTPDGPPEDQDMDKGDVRSVGVYGDTSGEEPLAPHGQTNSGSENNTQADAAGERKGDRGEEA